jgi:hypothetical protein
MYSPVGDCECILLAKTIIHHEDHGGYEENN